MELNRQTTITAAAAGLVLALGAGLWLGVASPSINKSMENIRQSDSLSQENQGLETKAAGMRERAKPEALEARQAEVKAFAALFPPSARQDLLTASLKSSADAASVSLMKLDTSAGYGNTLTTGMVGTPKGALVDKNSDQAAQDAANKGRKPGEHRVTLTPTVAAFDQTYQVTGTAEGVRKFLDYLGPCLGAEQSQANAVATKCVPRGIVVDALEERNDTTAGSVVRTMILKARTLVANEVVPPIAVE